MKRSRVIITSVIFILFLITALISSSLQATSVEPPLYFGIAEIRTTTDMGYAMGNPTYGSERIWKIVKYSDTNYDDPTEVSAYCIKADQGFSNDTLTDIYDVSYDMKTEKDDIAKQNDVLKGLIDGGQYDNLLALADILYVKGVSTEAERKKLLDDSGASDVIEKSDFSAWEEYYITDDEIDAVQQAAIWYFTNYQEGGEYDHYNQDSWIWYTSVDNKGVYNNLSSYDPKGMVATDATAGYYREQQMVKLYRYLIDTAKSNAEKDINDEKTILTVYASNENPEAQPIMEVVKLPREFDLSLRKYITAVNDETIENTREPNIDKTNLDNESATTATYQHRKDPVEVKTNDIITYNITIYNEGEKAGRATEIIDQLPEGLEFVEVVSGNFEKSAYSTQDNTLYLTRKANNTTNLPAYTEGTLSSETIQIKCKVTAEGGETDKILTNIAWIAEEIDENDTVITNNPGEDRDSEPSTITTQTKEQLVTTDNGYTGNSSNTGKELTNAENYFEGQQDDDDFEKVIVRAVTSIDVSKVWDDNENQDGLRTDNVVVELLIDGKPSGQTITLKADEWTGSFENLPTKIDGKDVTYSVKETTSINGYTTNTKSTDSTGKSFTITNTHKIFDLSLRKYIIKVGDTDITDRTPSINTNSLTTGTTATYNHKKNPVVVETGDTVIYNLTIYNEGEKSGRATKIEDQLPTGLKFVEVVSGNFELDSYSETDNLLKLKRTSNTDNLSAYDGGATLASESIQIKCEVTAQAGSEDSILTNIAWISEAYDAEDNKTITTTPKDDTDSEPGTTPNVNKDDLVTEDEGYIGNRNNGDKDLTSSQEYFEGEQDDDDFEKIVIEARTQITVTKQWNDNNNQDGKRPESVEVELYKNGTATGETKELTGDTWTATFDNLPVYENGEKITYTVKEVNVPEGYTVSGDGTEGNGYTITNTYTPEVTSVNVNKVWNDNNNQDGIRPNEIEVELLKNGQETGNTVILNADNNWADTFDNLPVYENGEKITYTVKEITVSGYAVNITQNGENDFTITNTHTPGVTSVTVNKVWDDKDDQDGLRPDSIEVELLKNGEPTGNILTLNEENHWTGTFNNLPIKENGVEIEYTVRENTQIEGYTTEITENTESTNSIESADNTNSIENIASIDETQTTTVTYATKSMVRATTENVEPKNFTITNTHIVEEAFDLALRKFIVAVSEDETIEESDILMNEDGTGYAREPVVDASKLNTTDENGNMITTAIYNHTKEPVLVEKNNIVIYMLRVYNEGEQDGYATEITDYLPPYLTFVDGEYNARYGWEVSSDGRTVTTRYLENSLITKPQTDESGNQTLSYVQVPIMCRVSDNVNANENITNIADITEYQDKDKQPVEDRDSEQDNVEIPGDEELPGYKDDEINQDYVPGQEDDDDFEKIYVQDFDLALRKFISEVDGTAYNREPDVDLSGLENGTTAIYNHTKDPVLVKRNSVIIYTIRVYNEGEIDGYVQKITDYLPEELEFLPEHEINIAYEWNVSEDGRTVTTDYLSSAKETTERQNLIKAFDGETLDYKEVQIACKVKEEASSNVKLTNLAEITEDSDEDRDSTPNNIEVPGDEELPGYKDDEINQDYVPGQEDDDDFEKVIIKDFDLALRKFITKVDEEEVTTRIPEVSYDREQNQITYNHTKDPVEVITGNVVEYTIRIYNEGDIAGYAEEVADDIPDGLKFLPENATNTEYRWVMYDKDGNVTENVEEAVEIRTDYLSKEKEETEGENLLQAFNPNAEIGEENSNYRDIKVAFEVIEPNESDRIIVNSAQITEDGDENGNSVEDIDSIPDEWNDGEDDQDREYIKLTYFDLALRKWVTEAIVIENGQQTVTQTGHTAEMDPEPVVKVELYRKNINAVTVKFRYSIRITNEGDIAGYAKEITDYVPEGLKFVAEDNPGWTDEGNNIISTRLLENTLLQPGESAEAEVVLTWINGEDTMGQMTNIAEISEDYNDKGAEDRDSTPDNQVWGEDDIDDAPVLLSIETGQERIYYVLGFTVLGTLAGGLVLIKKFVI